MTEPVKQIEQPFLPRYHVTHFVGEGAAARIYQVTDTRDGSVKAIKALKPQSNAEPSIVKRFEDEYQILRRLHHPSLPEVHDYGFTQDQIRYIVMELVEGVHLDQYFQSNPQDLWLLLYEICEVLSFIHDRDLLHFDIKPANILVKRTSAYGDEKPMVVLMDFGLSYRRDVGGERSLVGTPEYMAPEIIKGDGRLTRAADYYSLGITLYQLLAGETPFHGTINDVFQGHLRHNVKFQQEKTQYAELYPHVLGLVAKDINPRLEAFEEFRRAVIGRLRGEVQDLERVYGFSIISSIGMIGKEEAWEKLNSWMIQMSSSSDTQIDIETKPARVFSLNGPSGIGKSYLVDRAIQQAQLRNARVWRIGNELTFDKPVPELKTGGDHDSDVQSNQIDTNVLLVDRFERLWNQLASESHTRICLIVTDGIESLSEDDRQFLEYLIKRLAIVASERTSTRIFILIAGNRPGFLRNLNSIIPKALIVQSHAVHPLQALDFREIIDELHEPPVTAEDNLDLMSFIQQFGDSPGAIAAALHTAQIRGALRFSDGRWRFRKNLTSDLTPESTPAQSFYQEILSNLPPEAASVVEGLSCHDGPVPATLLIKTLPISADALTVSLKHLKPFRMVSQKNINGSSALYLVSPSANKAIFSSMSATTRIRMHEAYIRIYRSYIEASDSIDLEHRFAALEQLAYQFRRAGQYRNSIRVQINLVRLLRQHRQFSLLRRICESALATIEQDFLATPEATSWHRSRFFVIQLVDACWVLDDYSTIRSSIDSYYSTQKDRTPVSLLLKYALSLIALGDPKSVLKVSKAIKSRFPNPRTACHVTALLVDATIYSVTAQYSKALTLLDEVAQHQDLLGEYGQCRLYMSYVVVYDLKHDLVNLFRHTATLETLSANGGYMHEYLTSQSVRFAVALGNSQLSECKKITNAAIATASRHKMYNRLVYWYFRASNVYYEEGDYKRAIRHVNNTLRLSEKLGYERKVPELISRLAMNYQSAGLYGNSITHIQNALSMWDRSWDASVGAVIYLFALEIHLMSNSRHCGYYWTKARQFISTHAEIGRWGYFWFLAGLYHLRNNSPRSAHEAFRKARLRDHQEGARDDAARSGIKEAFSLLELAAFREARKVITLLQRLCHRLESNNIRTEYFALQVAYHCAVRSPAHKIRKTVEQCENEMRHATETPILLSTERILIRAKLRLGDIEDALEYFRAHLRRIKNITSNFTNNDYVQDFLNNEDEKLLMEEYRIIKGKRKGAQQPCAPSTIT